MSDAIQQAIESLTEAAEIFESQADDIDPSLMAAAGRCRLAIQSLQAANQLGDFDQRAQRAYTHAETQSLVEIMCPEESHHLHQCRSDLQGVGMSKEKFIDPTEWRVERWPPTPTNGMLTGNMSTGVRVTHIPTGIVEIEEQSRHMHINKTNAVNRILNLLSAGKETV